MNGYDSEQVMLGTWGELWVNGQYMAETTAFRAEVMASYADIKRVRNLVDGKKLSGLAGEGEVTLHKVSSYLMSMLSEAFKAGKVPDITIISKLSDPNAIGAERCACYKCKFEKTTLADWERGTVGEESYAFTFEDWELLDKTKNN